MFSSLGFTHFECLTFGNFLKSRPRDQPAPGLDFQQLLVKADGRLGLHFLNRPPAAPESGKTTQEWSAGSSRVDGFRALVAGGALWQTSRVL